jgi:hypothetical protein
MEDINIYHSCNIPHRHDVPPVHCVSKSGGTAQTGRGCMSESEVEDLMSDGVLGSGLCYRLWFSIGFTVAYGSPAYNVCVFTSLSSMLFSLTWMPGGLPCCQVKRNMLLIYPLTHFTDLAAILLQELDNLVAGCMGLLCAPILLRGVARRLRNSL